jgi:hypothetical protein
VREKLSPTFRMIIVLFLFFAFVFGIIVLPQILGLEKSNHKFREFPQIDTFKNF